MRKLFLILLFALPVKASYVQSGKSDFATAASTVCSPNSGTGSVVAGHGIVIGVQANSTTGVTISSTRVVSWTLIGPETQAGGTVLTYLYYGFAASSGVESITVAFTSGSALIGSACTEVTSNSFDASGHISGTGSLGLNITTTHSPDDAVAFATSGAGSATSGLTDRQFVQFTGTSFDALGTGTFAASGLNSVSTGSSGSSTALGLAMYTTASSKRKTRSQVIRYKRKKVNHAQILTSAL